MVSSWKGKGVDAGERVWLRLDKGERLAAGWTIRKKPTRARRIRTITPIMGLRGSGDMGRL